MSQQTIDTIIRDRARITPARVAIAAMLVTVWDAVAIAVAAMLEAIGNAVVVTVAATTCCPARRFHEPAPIALHPVRLRVHVARAFSNPDAGGPLIAVAMPIPVARLPDVASAMRRDHLVTRRRGRDARRALARMQVSLRDLVVAGAMISILANPFLFHLLDRRDARKAAPAEETAPNRARIRSSSPSRASAPRRARSS